MARARPVGLPPNLSESPNGLVRYVSPCPCRSTGEGLSVGIRWRCERQKGIGVRRLSKELGLSADTLRAWLGVVGDGATAKMKSVRVVERPASSTTPGRFTLVSASVYRVEGLSQLQAPAEAFARAGPSETHAAAANPAISSTERRAGRSPAPAADPAPAPHARPAPAPARAPSPKPGAHGLRRELTSRQSREQSHEPIGERLALGSSLGRRIPDRRRDFDGSGSLTGFAASDAKDPSPVRG